LLTIVAQPRQCLSAGFALRLRRDLELRLKSLAVLVLRFTEPGEPAMEGPGNLHIGKTEIPVGLDPDFRRAVDHRGGESVHQVRGHHRRSDFQRLFFTIFTLSERHVARERHGKPEQLDQFRVYGNQELGSGAMGVRPGNILVAVRDPRNLYYLRQVLASTNTTKQDVW
jgi:hypothetical protein